MIGSKLNMGQQYALAAKTANSALSCIHRTIASRSRDVVIPLHLALVKLYLEYAVQIWGPSTREIDRLVQVEWRVSKAVSRLEHLPCEERLRELDPFIVDKRQLWGT